MMMSALAGLVPEVRTIVSSAVSLHPVLTGMGRWKLLYVARGLTAAGVHGPAVG